MYVLPTTCLLSILFVYCPRVTCGVPESGIGAHSPATDSEAEPSDSQFPLHSRLHSSTQSIGKLPPIPLKEERVYACSSIT